MRDVKIEPFADEVEELQTLPWAIGYFDDLRWVCRVYPDVLPDGVKMVAVLYDEQNVESRRDMDRIFDAMQIEMVKQGVDSEPDRRVLFYDVDGVQLKYGN